MSRPIFLRAALTVAVVLARGAPCRFLHEGDVSSTLSCARAPVDVPPWPYTTIHGIWFEGCPGDGEDFGRDLIREWYPKATVVECRDVGGVHRSLVESDAPTIGTLGTVSRTAAATVLSVLFHP